MNISFIIFVVFVKRFLVVPLTVLCGSLLSHLQNTYNLFKRVYLWTYYRTLFVFAHARDIPILGLDLIWHMLSRAHSRGVCNMTGVWLLDMLPWTHPSGFMSIRIMCRLILKKWLPSSYVAEYGYKMHSKVMCTCTSVFILTQYWIINLKA